jgi:hypothetical protein
MEKCAKDQADFLIPFLLQPQKKGAKKSGFAASEYAR